MTPPAPWSRRQFLTRAAIATPAAAALAGCSAPEAAPSPGSPTTRMPTTPAGPSREPAPVRVGGLSCVAQQQEQQLFLRTAGGDVAFWAGVTISGSMPGAPAQAIDAAAQDYRRWFPMMAALGVRFVHVARIHPPHMYAELLRYNTAHPASPLYLVQGVTVPAATARTEGDALDLFADTVTEAMNAQIRDASAAVHGTLRRRAAAGRVHGSWTADVSPWTAAWLVGIGIRPEAIAASDRANADAARHSGRYFSSLPEATPTERWLAARLDELAALEAGQGLSAPIAFANQPHTDPLAHDAEPLPNVDLVSLDANHVVATRAWPAGTFAGYAAAPYAPDFMLLQPEYFQGADPFGAYLLDLRQHHPRLPLVVTSFGVTSALGSGDNGTHGRDQGNHTEQRQAQINADLLRLLHDTGLAGGILSAWHDDWSATTWNTAPRYAPVPDARRVLWHDALTADQWAGVITQDPVRAGERVVHSAPADGLQRIVVDTDAAWLYLTFEFAGRVTSPVEIGFDYVPDGGLRLPGGSGQAVHDVAVRMVPTMSTAQLLVRSALDPIRFDGFPATALPRGEGTGWRVARLSLNRPVPDPLGERAQSPAFLDIGELRLGTWDPAAAEPNSLATWELSRESADEPARLRFRLPWSMLGVVDPSARSVLTPSFVRPEATNVRSMTVTVESSTPGSPITFPLSWQTWNTVRVTERLKAGTDVLAQAFADVSRR